MFSRVWSALGTYLFSNSGLDHMSFWVVKRLFDELKAIQETSNCCVVAAWPVFLDPLGVNGKEHLKRRSQSEELFCIYLPWRRKLEFLPKSEYLIFQWIGARPINTFSPLNIYGLFYILSLWNFLREEIGCITSKKDNVISEICYLASEESPDLKYQHSHLLTSSKHPAVIITVCSCLDLGKYSLQECHNGRIVGKNVLSAYLTF